MLKAPTKITLKQFNVVFQENVEPFERDLHSGELFVRERGRHAEKYLNLKSLEGDKSERMMVPGSEIIRIIRMYSLQNSEGEARGEANYKTDFQHWF